MGNGWSERQGHHSADDRGRTTRQRRRIAAIFVGVAATLCVVSIASGLGVTTKFPSKAKAKVGAIVDEAGTVLFGSTSPGKVEVTNFPQAPSQRVEVTNFPPGPGQVEVTNLAALPTPLAPHAPSDLRTLVAFTGSGACPDDGLGGNVSRSFDGVVLPGSGGVYDAFSVPQGQVFVATRLDWVITGASASQIISVRLRPETATTSNVADALGTTLADAGGNAGGSLDLGSGAIIRSNEQFCFVVKEPVGDIEAVLRGFFAADS